MCYFDINKLLLDNSSFNYSLFIAESSGER